MILKRLACSGDKVAIEELALNWQHDIDTNIECLKASLLSLGITAKTYADVRGFNGQRVRSDIVAIP